MCNTVIIISLILIILYLVIKIRITRKRISEMGSILEGLLRGESGVSSLSEVEGELRGIGSGIMILVESMERRMNSMSDEIRFMKAVIEGMDDGIMVIDKNGKIVFINDRFYEIMAIPKESIGGKYFIDLIREPKIIELVKNVMNTCEVLRDNTVLNRGTENIYLDLMVIPIMVDGSLRWIAISVSETTRLIKLEKMRRDFVANVSHEIKTPVTMIKGFAETLLDGALDKREDAIRFLSLIKSHSERLNNLVDDLLTLSSIELEDVKIEKREVKLDEVVDVVYATLDEKARAKGLYMKKDISPQYTVYADRDRLIQILLNLVDNAIKFTENGGVTVGIEDGNILYVSDTGIGIPREHIPRLGERFYRVDKARSRSLGGTGLGLAIVKHLVRAHGWRMEIESAQGKGTKVKIFISENPAFHQK